MANIPDSRHHIIKLNKQPRFPMEDLTSDNATMLKYVLANEAGVHVYSEQLQQSQRYVYMIAHRALRMLGMHTTYSPGELRAFSHGFAGFETINDLMHEARTYNMAPAASRVAEFLVDTRDLVDIQAEREIFEPAEDPNEPGEIVGDGSYRMLLTPGMEDALTGVPSLPAAGPNSHDKADPEKIFTGRHAILPQQYPNTYDVIVSMGEVRNETMAQLQLRIAGAGLARTLQTTD